MDFFLPDMVSEGKGEVTILLRPMPFWKAQTTMRKLLQASWMGDAVYSYAQARSVGLHSWKKSVLAFAAQRQAPQEQRALQGHHRMLQGMKSVRLYSCDDGP